MPTRTAKTSILRSPDGASALIGAASLALVVAIGLGLFAPPPATAAGENVRYFGYFAARLTLASGNHLAEVADRSNLNWVQISDVDRYRPEVLDGCKPAGCVVSTGHEFFTGCDAAGSPDCRLHPEYRQRWARLSGAIGSRISKVAAFYLLDEPQWRGASPADIATAAATIKSTRPGIPVMMVEAGPAVTASLQVPREVDWVGFDWYCRSFSDIQSKLATLERRTSTAQQLFLMPEAAPLKECGGKPGHATDAQIAQLQWSYYNLAAAHPRVVGLLAFGFWTSGHDSSDLPLTVAAHRQIAARVIRAAQPPPPQPPAPAPPPVATPAAHVKLPSRRMRMSPRAVLRVAVRCPRAAPATCAGRLVLHARLHGRRREVARTGFSVRPGHERRVRVRIRPGARHAVLRRARRRAGVRLVATARTPAGTTRRALTVRTGR